MAKDIYQVDAADLQQLITQLNFFFSQISDRLDQLEGLRGSSQITGTLNMPSGEIVITDANGNELQGFKKA